MANLIKKIRTEQGDLQIDYNALANLPQDMASQEYVNTSIASFSNPNLLINSDFRNPVNQRGKTTYPEASDWTYGIDRWKYFNQMTVEILTGAVKFASHGTGQSWFMQEFEKALPADNYTLSVKVSSVSGTCDMKFENSSGVQAEKVINSTGITTLSFNGSVNAVSFELDGNGSQLTIEWVKLEAGTAATPFVPRLYSEEFILCQRYYQTTRVHRTIRSDVYNEEIIETIPYGIALRRVPTLTSTVVDSFNIHDLSTSDDGDTHVYRVTYKLSSDHGTGHMFELTLVADAEIY